MSHLLFLQIWTLYVFPNESYKPLKWQIWKCELGWFSLRGSHISQGVAVPTHTRTDRMCTRALMNIRLWYA